jgi:DNA-binding CsgD family transcriptional regulator
MAVRVTTSTRDLRRLLELGDPARLHDDDGLFPRSILRELAELVPCDNVTYTVNDAYRRCNLGGVSLVCYDGTSSASDDEQMNAFYWQHFWSLPQCSYPDRTADWTTVVRESDFGSAEEFARGRLVEYLSMIGARHVIQMPLTPAGPVTHRILLWRTGGRGFSDRERMLLTLVRPHVDAIHQTRLRRQTRRGQLTDRQLDLLRHVAAGLDNRQIAQRLAISEATVRKHLENIYTRLEVTSRTAAVAKVFLPNLNIGRPEGSVALTTFFTSAM